MTDRMFQIIKPRLRDIEGLFARVQRKRYFPTVREIVLACAAYGGTISTDLAKSHGLLVTHVRSRIECARVAVLLEPAVLTRFELELKDLYGRASADLQLDLSDDMLRCALHNVLLLENPSADAKAMLRIACFEGFPNAWLDGRESLGQFIPGAVDQTTEGIRLRHGIETSMAASQETLLIAAGQRCSTLGLLWSHLAEREMKAFVEALHGSVHDVDITAKVAEFVPKAPSSATSDVVLAVTVISRPTQKLTCDTKRLWDNFDEISNKVLPFVIAPCWGIVRQIGVRWPYTSDVVAIPLVDVVADTSLRLRPTLLVCAPSSRKPVSF